MNMINKDNSKRRNSYLEIVKSVVLGALVISMVALVVVYIRGTHVYESMVLDGENSHKSFDKLWSVEGGAGATGLDTNHLVPEFIGYRQAGAQMACTLAGADTTAELYALIKPCLLELLGSDSVCHRLDAAEGQQLFLKHIEGDEFVYLRYHVPVLYQLVYAFASEKLTIAETDIAPGEDGSISAYISELIIVPDLHHSTAAHRYIAYAHDGEGGYFEFRLGDHVKTSDFYTSQLAERGSQIGAYPFYFVKDDKMPLTQPMVQTDIEYALIEQSTLDISNESLHMPLLSLFGYNPDKLNSYVDDTGAYVYVDSSSRLRIAPDLISFATNDAIASTERGIGIGSMLGYSRDESFNLFDKLTAVDNFIRSLGKISDDLIGAEGSLCLGSVYSQDSTLIIEYFLTYNNIRVSKAPALRIALSNDTISAVDLFPRIIKSTTAISYSLRPEFTLRKLVSLGIIEEGNKIGGLRMLYDGPDAVWSVILK